jgi:hypothetical protein
MRLKLMLKCIPKRPERRTICSYCYISFGESYSKDVPGQSGGALRIGGHRLFQIFGRMVTVTPLMKSA